MPARPVPRAGRAAPAGSDVMHRDGVRLGMAVVIVLGMLGVLLVALAGASNAAARRSHCRSRWLPTLEGADRLIAGTQCRSSLGMLPGPPIPSC